MKTFWLLSLLGCQVASFSTTPPPHAASSHTVLRASSTDSTSSSSTDETTTIPLLDRDRYVASNRFAVRAGKEAKFEKRWATRKSRLAELDGFRYFHLMRRVSLEEDGTVTYDGGDDKESSQGNYVSFTIWDNKPAFTAWRKGDAFKEAHGGTSLTAFVSTMVSSALVLRGPPRPVFYDGLLVQSEPPEVVPATVNGWRTDIEFPTDGSTLPVECFVACNQFFVPSETAAAFEQRWKNRESQLRSCDGFVSFSMLRRDAKMKDRHAKSDAGTEEPTYMSTTIWKDRASFDKWRSGANFSKAHGKDNNDKKEEEEDAKPAAAAPTPQWSRPPIPVFYEGTLVISTKEGA
mmetsp:Transcript_27835/g.42144  ORF Transcript_27835/g.42144 Transcript_27835/m.42144 type:complete len:348 (+) Transcript_27835:122-1165(+)|eukprot:CAMPEP_0178899358 /NCGR_PEP_ID=MMETSP0786-20121207/2851_1 /TAXON_ID=186022 /ORGANISM="Thalassionema frauenfeldii, Strain CCMP 1798" /LENGTH=347 /DNA_ID=CAMNT_0020570197 /DNA_START=30 /DNA_END=1073 /DNA_ORIENTATION=-